MAVSMNTNSSFISPEDLFIRQEMNKYISKFNLRMIPVQSFVSLSGLLANILALIIINRKSSRNTSSAVFITFMAIFDSGVLLIHLASLLKPRRNVFIFCSLAYLSDVFTFCANWVLVIITLGKFELFLHEDSQK